MSAIGPGSVGSTASSISNYEDEAADDAKLAREIQIRDANRVLLKPQTDLQKKQATEMAEMQAKMEAARLASSSRRPPSSLRPMWLMQKRMSTSRSSRASMP
jgi:hypothetical protein